MLCRPLRVPRTSPAPARTRRCLATAWRVMPEPAVSVPIDAGPPDSREMSCSRVSSPRAAKIEADCRGLARAGKIAADIVDLPRPPRIILPIGLVPPGDRQPIEPGLGHRQAGALRYLLQLEYDQCCRFGRVFVRIPARLPAPGEQPLWLHAFHQHLEGEMGIPGNGDGPS